MSGHPGGPVDPERGDVFRPVAMPRRHRRRRGDTGQEEGRAPPWLVTFTDVMGLMLTFFVLMYAMREPEPRTFETLSGGFQREVARIFEYRRESGGFDTIDLGRIDFDRALDLDYLESLLRQRVEEREDVLKGVVLVPQSESLIVSLPQDLVFASGKEEVSEGGRAALGAMAGILGRIRNRIEIIGHADPQPVSDRNPAYGSNWDLSLSRAVAAAQGLREQGYDRPMVVRGLGKALYRALPAGLPDSFRETLSRRVDIVVMKDDGNRSRFLDIGTD